MDIETARKKLDDYEKHLFAYSHAMSIMGMDAQTAAPSGSYGARGVSMGILTGELLKYSSDDEIMKLVDSILDGSVPSDNELMRRAELLHRAAEERRVIPTKDYIEYRQLLNEAGTMWKKAKAADDYASFAPYIEKITDTLSRFSQLKHPEQNPYDVMLDSFEEGTDTKYYDSFFNEVKKSVTPVIAAIGKSTQPDDGWLKVSYPIEKQRKLSEALIDIFCLDRNHCTLAEAEHPLTGGSSSQDVRISTHYYENDPLSSMFSVIHEGGHANYRLHIDPRYDYNCLGKGASSGVHESQSRFWENYVGRNKSFTGYLWPVFSDIFPEQCKGHTSEEFYRCINKSTPSLIRTQADELTYSVHIMIRYELEKKLFAGELDVMDLPREWNKMYEEYLGVEVPNDSKGILQDIHWSMGYMGYFCTYSLGTAYSAQILDTVKAELPFDNLLSHGNLQPILDLLSERLYRKGSLIRPVEAVPLVTGKPFSAEYYTRYLTEKYSSLYTL